MKCLNLGCGTRFHSDWVNLDSIAHSESVIKHDLKKGIPFEDASFDVVYHSHVLEHFPQAAGQQLMLECYRVLRPQGILRVAVPNLEQIARAYLLALEKSLAGDYNWRLNYDWMLLELFDQANRNQTGGDMVDYLKQPTIPNEDFIIHRIGNEAQAIINVAKEQPKSSAPTLFRHSLIATTKHLLWKLREQLYRLLLRSEYSALQIGRFRKSGEIHYQMYDRYSLALLLQKVGFVAIAQRTANDSYIPNWSSYNLDTEPDGTIYKPDSLFMEAIKSTK